MGFFSSKPKTDPIKEALVGGLKSSSLFSDQEIEFYSNIAEISSPSGELGRYINKGKYHCHVTLSYYNGNLSISVQWDPGADRQGQLDRIKAKVAPYSGNSGYEVTTPLKGDAFTDPCFRLSKSVSSSSLASAARTMANDAATITRSIGSI